MINLILNEDVPAYGIVALTFTNKAAREMQERVHSALPPELHPPLVGTFHSYCLKLLKINRHLTEIPDFGILDSDDQLKLLKKIIKKYNLAKETSAKQASAIISQLKNAATSAKDLNPNNLPTPLFRQIFQEYEKEKKASHCLDFDDLLLHTLFLFQKNPEFKKSFQSRIRHLLVDEYQDTNHVQHALLKEMTLEAPKNLHSTRFALSATRTNRFIPGAGQRSAIF